MSRPLTFLDAAFFVIMVGVISAAFAYLGWNLAARYGTPPPPRCYVLEVVYIEPNSDYDINGIPVPAGRYALHDCGTGVLIRERLP